MPNHEILINQKATLKDALLKLNANPSCLTLLVLNEEEVIVGTITDGDIRRALLNDHDNSSLVADFANSSFIYLREGEYAPETVARIKKKGIKTVPILDKHGRLRKIINFDKISTVLPIDAVIMAGGKGTRLLPLTKKTPKPLLRIGDKPIIEHNIDRLRRFGIFNQYISINHLGEQIIQFFGDGAHKDINIQYVKEEQPLGTIGAVTKINEFENNYILVMNSDILTDIDYASLFQEMKEKNADMVVSTTSYDVKVPYGIIETNGNEVTHLVEKPTYTYYSNAGIYLIKKEYLNWIPEEQVFNATDLLEKLIQAKKKVVHFQIPGYWLDIGRPKDFEKAQTDIKLLNL